MLKKTQVYYGNPLLCSMESMDKLIDVDVDS